MLATNNSGINIAAGTGSISGSNLKPANVTGTSDGSTLTGSWRAMGYKSGTATSFSSGRSSETTLWVRVS